MMSVSTKGLSWRVAARVFALAAVVALLTGGTAPVEGCLQCAWDPDGYSYCANAGTGFVVCWPEYRCKAGSCHWTCHLEDFCYSG